MCIIAIKPTGIEPIDKNILATCFDNNPHGAGFMLSRNGKVEISKGHMTMEAYWQALENAHITTKDTVIYHCRIGTAGGNTPENTHPFPISKSLKRLKELNTTTDIGIAHNGIISIEHNKDESDTMAFIKKILASKTVRNNLKEPAITELIANYTKTSRLAILYGNADIVTTGTGWTTKNGITYSNSTYKETPFAKWDIIEDLCPDCYNILEETDGTYICNQCGVFVDFDGCLVNVTDIGHTNIKCPECKDSMIEIYSDICCPTCNTFME